MTHTCSFGTGYHATKIKILFNSFLKSQAPKTSAKKTLEVFLKAKLSTYLRDNGFSTIEKPDVAFVHDVMGSYFTSVITSTILDGDTAKRNKYTALQDNLVKLLVDDDLLMKQMQEQGAPKISAKTEGIVTLVVPGSDTSTPLSIEVAPNKELPNPNIETAIETITVSTDNPVQGKLDLFKEIDETSANQAIVTENEPLVNTGAQKLVPVDSRTLPQPAPITGLVNLKTQSDIDNVFLGSIFAKTLMESWVNNLTIRDFLIDKETFTYLTPTGVDSTIKTFKENQLRYLVHYIMSKKSDGIKFNVEDEFLYDENGIISPSLNSTLAKISYYFTNIAQVNTNKLDDWARSNPDTEGHDNMKAYMQFILLANFDTFVLKHGQGIFSIGSGLINSPSENFNTVKYHLDIDNNLRSHIFTGKEQYALSEEQTSVYKALLNIMPTIKWNRGAKADNKLSIDPFKKLDIITINSTIIRMLKFAKENAKDARKNDLVPQFDRANPSYSLQILLEYIVNKYINPDPKINKKLHDAFNSSNLDILTSLYMFFYRNSDTEEVLGKVLGQKAYTEYTQKGIREKLGPSYHQISINTGLDTSRLDYMSIITFNINKSDFNDYTEVSYDRAIKDLNFNRPDSKIFEGKAIQFKNSLNTEASHNYSGDTTLVNEDLANISIDYKDGVVVFNNIQPGKNVTVHLGNSGVDMVDLSKITITDNIFDNAVFVKFMEDNIPMMTLSTKEDLKEELVKATGTETPVKAAELLFSVAAASAFVKGVYRDNNYDIQKVLKNPFLKNRMNNDRRIFDESVGEEGIVMTTMMYDTLNDNINVLAKAFAAVDGSLDRAVIKVANGNAMPLQAETRYLYMTRDIIDLSRRLNVGVEHTMPTASNFFMQNRDNIGFETAIRTYIGKEKHSTDLTPQELAITSILHEFFGASQKENAIYIQPTVYTDKNTHNTLKINLNKPYKFTSKIGFPSFTFKTATNKVLVDSMYYSNATYYENLGARMMDVYSQAFINYIGGPENLEIYASQRGLPLLTDNKYTKIEIIDMWMRSMNELSFRNSFYAIPQNPGLVEDFGIRKSEIETTDVDGNVSKKTIIHLPETLVHFSNMYKSGAVTAIFTDFMDSTLDSFIEDLEEFNVQIPFTSFGADSPVLVKAINDYVQGDKDADLVAEFKDKFVDPAGNMKLKAIDGTVNPLLTRYFYTTVLISDAYQQLTMGTIHDHPAKGKVDKSKNKMSQLIGLQTALWDKRQLGGTPMKPFLQNLITGVRETVTTVHVQDARLNVFSSYGTEDVMDVTDGAIFTSMAQIILANNSLLDNRVGVNMKTLGLSMDPYYNTFNLEKCAEFGMTNEWSRLSSGAADTEVAGPGGRFNDIGETYKNTYGIPLTWTGADGSTYTPDIMTDFNDNTITIKDIAPQGAFYKLPNGNIMEVIEIKKGPNTEEGHNQILVKLKNLNQELATPNRDIPYKVVAVTNLHDLWQIFGGIQSVSINPNGNITVGEQTFAHSDSSHYSLVEFINRVGTWLDQDGLSTLPSLLVQTHPDLKSKADIIKTNKSKVLKNTIAPSQTTVWQPLKSAFIGRYTFAKAKKSGASPIIPIEDMFRPGAFLPTKEVSLMSTGLLLGTEHETDDSELSEMTQIVSAITFNGDTFGIAQDAYETMSDLIGMKLREYTDALSERNGKNQEDFYNKVVMMLVKTFEAKNQQSVSNFVATLVKAKLSKKASISTDLVVQTEGVLSTENNALQVGIDMPFSAEIYSSFITLFANTINKDILKRKQSGLAAVLKPSGTTVKLYDVIVDGERKVITYDRLKSLSKTTLQEEVPVEQITMYDWVVDSAGNEIHLDSPSKLLSFKERRIDGFASAPEGLVTKLYGKPRELKPREARFSIVSTNGAVRSIWETDVYSAIELFSKAVNGETLAPEQWNTIVSATTQKSGRAFTPEQLLTNTLETGQIFKNKIHEAFREIEEHQRVKLNGIWMPVENVEVLPGEALAPHIFMSKFGIPEGMQPDEVSAEFFEEMLSKKKMPTIVGADRFLRVANGNHLYIFSQQTKYNIENNLPVIIESDSKNIKGTFLDMSNKIEIIDGERWVLDDKGNLDYKLSDNALPYKFVQDGKVVDAVVIKTSSFEDSHIEMQQEFPTSIRPTENELDKSTKEIPALAKKMYASFLIALEFISARIPGQGPQSFTTVKVVGFLYTEGNTIMTNHYTSFLKGEDYDIDKGYWMGKTVSKRGLIETWVPYDYSTAQELRLLMALPVPNNKYERRRIVSGDPEAEVTLSAREVEAVASGLITEDYVKVINKLNRVASFNFESDTLPGIPEFMNKITEFFNHPLKKNLLEDIYKNKLSLDVYDMSASIKNTVHNESEVTLGDVRNAAKKVASKRPINPYNPADVYRVQYANMVGKKVVGIAAVSLKVWSALSYYGTKKASMGKYNDIFINKTVSINGKDYSFATFANINFNNRPGNELTEDLLTALVVAQNLDPLDQNAREEIRKNHAVTVRDSNFKGFVDFISNTLAKQPDATVNSINKVVQETVQLYDLNYDQSLVLSALLSAATDNAKELVLAKINAGPDTAGIYAHLTMLGMPFETIASMMTSEEIQWIVENSKANVYDKNSAFNNIKKAIEKRLSGPSLSEVTADSSVQEAMDWYYMSKAVEYLTANNLASGITTLVEKTKDKFNSPLSVKDARRFLGKVLENGEIELASHEEVTKYFKYLSSLPYAQRAMIPMHRSSVSDDFQEEDFSELTGVESDLKGNVAFIAKPSYQHINNVLSYLKSLKEDMFSTSRLGQVTSFQKINRDAEEINILGRIFSINQGLKTKAYDEYALIQRINNFVVNQLNYFLTGEDLKMEGSYEEDSDVAKKFITLAKHMAETLKISEIEAKNKLIQLVGHFDLNSYLNATNEDRNFIKTAYDVMKSTYNIFDIIETVPHYKEMLNAHKLVLEGAQSVSMKAKAMKKLLNLIVDEEIITTKKVGIAEGSKVVTILNLVPTIEDKNYKRLESLCDNIIILKWLKKLSPDRKLFSFDTNIVYKMENGKLNKVTNPSVSTVDIDLATIAGRANFITMTHNKILEWKHSQKDNAFIQDLNIDYIADDLLDKKWPFYRMSINVLANDDYSKNTFSTLVSAFNALPGDIKDILYLYNTLIHKNKVNRESFSKLFQYNNDYSTSTLFFKFQEAVARMDRSGENITEIKEDPDNYDFSIEDVIVEGIASRVYNFNGGFKGKYVYVISKSDDGNLKKEYHRWNENAYVPYKHFADRRSIPMGTDSEMALMVNGQIKNSIFKTLKEKLLGLAVSVNNINNIKINCI